jgi:hypothetical protein
VQGTKAVGEQVESFTEDLTPQTIADDPDSEAPIAF